MRDGWRAWAATLAGGFAGAAVAVLAGLPAGALIGSVIVVACMAGIGIRVGLPNRIRDLAFTTIGISLGSGVDDRLVDQLAAWGVSLAILVASLVATVALGRAILHRGFGFDAGTSVLASAPGTMSNALAIAAEGRGDVSAVMFLQLMRLLSLVLLVPPLAVMLDAPAAAVPGGDAPMALAPLAALLAVASLCGLAGSRLGIPAASLLSGMVLSAAGHATGLVDGATPDWLVFAAFALTGAALATRMSRVTPAQLRHYARAGLATILTAVLVSLAFALAAKAATGLPFAQVWIAYAPGGVEAMAAIGLSLGYDPAYVAVHHFARIFALVVIVPVALRL